MQVYFNSTVNITDTVSVNATNMTNVTAAEVASNRTVFSSTTVWKSDVITTRSYNDENTIPGVFASTATLAGPPVCPSVLCAGQILRSVDIFQEYSNPAQNNTFLGVEYVGVKEMDERRPDNASLWWRVNRSVALGFEPLMSELLRRGACVCITTADARNVSDPGNAAVTFYGNRYKLNRTSFADELVIDPRPCLRPCQKFFASAEGCSPPGTASDSHLDLNHAPIWFVWC